MKPLTVDEAVNKFVEYFADISDEFSSSQKRCLISSYALGYLSGTRNADDYSELINKLVAVMN